MSTIGTGVIDYQVCVCANDKTSVHLKSVFKMSTVCSNASLKTWTPLPDRFIDDHLVEMFPLLYQEPSYLTSLLRSGAIQLVDVTNLAALMQFPLNLVVDWVKVRTVSWPQSWNDEVRCFLS